MKLTFQPYIGAGEDITEASAMKNFLLGKGIDKNKIIMEDQSKNTMENLAFSKKIMECKGFKTAVVVSNKYHLKRVSLMSKRLKMNTLGFLFHTIYSLNI